ncbi:hypothetical protein B566_EDAN017055 [Ephemera danica]|nr:hypothetical protein B566_EDAN017055 [Ephemera danica]
MKVEIDNKLINSFHYLRELTISYVALNFNTREEIIETKIEIFRATFLKTTCKHHEDYIPSQIDPAVYQCNDEKLDIMLRNIIPKMGSLRFIDLTHNSLSSIPQNAFKNITANGVVILDRNYLDSKVTFNINSLSLLDLSRNRISNLDNFTFHGNIDNLNLSFNQIGKWNSNDIFNSDSRHIKQVNLSYNDIRAFDSEMIKSLSSLEVVDIGGNPLDCSNCLLYGFQQWLKSNTKIHVTNLGKHFSTFKCTFPSNLTGTLIFDAPFNELCYSQDPLYIGITIPLLIITIVFGILYYIYRFELVYMMHVTRVRNRAMDRRHLTKKYHYDAFVSYSSYDRTWVHDVLLQTLENDENKYALCLHERDFRLGRYIMENISECMNNSRNVILVLSPNFVSSKWCQWELKLVQQLMFENNPDFLILVELEKLRQKDLPSTLRLLMSTRTYLECPRAGADMTNFWIRLKQALGQPLGMTNRDDCQENDAEQQLNDESTYN